jgi:hypothetical protein
MLPPGSSLPPDRVPSHGLALHTSAGCTLFVRSLITTVMLIVVGVAEGQQISGGRASPEWGYADMQMSPDTLRQLADEGDATAAYLLGTRYASGRGGFRDDSRAFEWFLKAAELGMPDAQYNVSVMYATGRAVPRDLKKAMEWLKLSAAEEFPQAAADLGLAYMLGRGVAKDPKRALKWLLIAADQGTAVAQYHAGLLYERERAVGLDRAKAMKWYERAAGIGYGPAKKKLASLEAQDRSDPGTSTSPSRATATARTPRSPVRSGSIGRAVYALPPGNFTIQLASLRARSSAQEAIRRLKLGRSARVIGVVVKGNTGYVILYGAYNTRKDAERAVAELPAALRKDKPWVRRVSDLKVAP